MSHRLIQAMLRLSGYLQRVGPVPRERIEFSPIIQSSIDLGMFLRVTKTQVILVTDSGGGSSSQILGGTSVPAGEIWHVNTLRMERLSGDNTADRMLLAYVNDDSNPAVIDSFSGQTAKQFASSESQPDFWMYPGDTLGITFAGAGAAATVFEYRLSTLTYVTEADED